MTHMNLTLQSQRWLHVFVNTDRNTEVAGAQCMVEAFKGPEIH